MVRRHRHQRRDVEAARKLAQPLEPLAARGLVARVEQHHAAVLHVLIQLADGLLRESGLRGVDRPIEKREEGEVVGLQVHPQGPQLLGGGAPVQDEAEAVEPRLAQPVQLGVAGAHIGELGRGGGGEGEAVRSGRDRFLA